jgi:hypothetical protein
LHQFIVATVDVSDYDCARGHSNLRLDVKFEDVINQESRKSETVDSNWKCNELKLWNCLILERQGRGNVIARGKALSAASATPLESEVDRRQALKERHNVSAIESIAHFQRSWTFVVLFQGRRASLCSALAPGYSSPRRWRSGGCTSSLKPPLVRMAPNEVSDRVDGLRKKISEVKVVTPRS